MFSKVRILFALLALLLAAGTVAAGSAFVEPDVTVLQMVTGGNSGWFGWVAENLGDVDGDGVNDFVTSDPFYTSAAGGSAGAVFVVSGATGSILQQHEGAPGSVLGYSATRAGFVDGDAVPDYVAGAPGASRAVVYSGADHTILLDLTAPAGTGFGASVATAGDLNGDGHDDILVGATGQDSGAGAVHVYSGADGSLLRSHAGPAGGSLGSALGKIGDVTGDGIPDYVAGARTAGKQGRGEAYAYSGADGAVLYAMTPVGEPGTTPTFGLFFASGAGDVNGDGVPDVFIGDYNATLDGVSGSGRAYVFSGADGTRIKVLNAQNTGDGFGPGRGIGDIDGDGHGDLIVGAYSSSAGATAGGQAYLISGRNGQPLRTLTGATPFQFVGVDVLGMGDVNGDGVQDYLLTGAGIVYLVAG